MKYNTNIQVFFGKYRTLAVQLDCYFLTVPLTATPQRVLLLVCDYSIINWFEQSTVTKVVRRLMVCPLLRKQGGVPERGRDLD